MKKSLLTSRLLKNSLLVILLLTAGTAFSQTAQNAGKNPQGTPNPEEHADATETPDDQDLGETSPTEQDSESITEEDTAEEIISPAIPAKPDKITAEQAIPEGPPQWAKDLRRGEIIAFGSLPFTFFFTQTVMGLFRMASHGWDNRYAPSLFRGAGGVPMTNTELKIMIGLTISASVLVAVVDHFIVKHKRNKARESQK